MSLFLQIKHDFFVDLLNVLLRQSQLLLQPYFFLLQGILGSLGELGHEVFNLIGDFSSAHGVDHVLAVGVKLRWEDLRHGLRGVSLVNSG